MVVSLSQESKGVQLGQRRDHSDSDSWKLSLDKN